MLDNKRYSAYLLTGQSDLSGWKQEWLNKVYEKTGIINENTCVRSGYMFKIMFESPEAFEYYWNKANNVKGD